MPLDANAFAARKIGSAHQGDKEFAPVADWTPKGAASRATRHYISGGAAEIRRLAAHLASLSGRLAKMLEKPTSALAVANSLAPPTSLALSAAPPFHVGVAADELEGVPSLQTLSARAAVDGGALAEDARGAGYPTATVCALSAAETSAKAAASASAAEGALTCERVHELMVARLGLTRTEAEEANPCFKCGVLMGHIVLSEATTLDTVVFRGRCICCSAPHTATISDVLHQPVYGGNDYEDGGQEGTVQCEGCCGMYVTGLCEGRLSFDSGKFHNHCVECPNFGKCLGDYREAHCMDCGKHWFMGMSGFACSHCGGGHGGGRKL